MTKKNSKKGFTLVELVIVIAILAVLATVAIPAITPLTTDAKANVDAVNAKTIESVLKLAVVEASKDSSTSVTLDAQQVFNAVYEANLNIKSGYFAYTVDTGSVAALAEETTGTPEVYLITFGAETNSVTKPLVVSDGTTQPDTYTPTNG